MKVNKIRVGIQLVMLMLTILFVVLLAACSQTVNANPNQNGLAVQPPSQAITATANSHPGKKLLETQCYVCHDPAASIDKRVAPPMVAIKSHYIHDDTTKAEFIHALTAFVKQPSIHNAKLKGAVKRFGVMPYQPFLTEDIQRIAEYLYDYKIAEPEWFKQHVEEHSKGNVKYRNNGLVEDAAFSFNEQTPAARGQQYALNTQKELGKNLMGTIQKKGTKAAVSFCSEQAYPITHRMAMAQNATIQRVSDKPRNPKNQANAQEQVIIERYKGAIANQQSAEPITTVKKGKVTFYAPIKTNAMCLQCHGTPNKTIQPDVYKTITSLYPQDRATGYGINQVRGIWSITFDE